MGTQIVLNGRFLLQNITGVQRVEREILKSLDYLATLGHIQTPKVYLPIKGDIIGFPELKTIKLERVGKLSGHLWEQIELPKYCKNKTLWCLGNTAPLVCIASKNVKLLTMVHDLSYKYFPNAYSWKFKALYSFLIPIILSHSDIVVTVSDSEKDAILKYYPNINRSNLFASSQNGGVDDDVANKVKQDYFHPLKERNYGIYVGSLNKRKNAEGVLKSAIEFLKKYKDMSFQVIGASSTVFESFDIEIPLEVKERLVMRGQINNPQEIYDAFSKARFLLFPSFYEASPLPPIEAMTFGCPVIASAIPSLIERCGDAALFCDPHTDGSIDDAVDRLMSSEGLWNQCSTAGREKASEYSWLKQTKKLLDLSGVKYA